MRGSRLDNFLRLVGGRPDLVQPRTSPETSSSFDLVTTCREQCTGSQSWYLDVVLAISLAQATRLLQVLAQVRVLDHVSVLVRLCVLVQVAELGREAVLVRREMLVEAVAKGAVSQRVLVLMQFGPAAQTHRVLFYSSKTSRRG